LINADKERSKAFTQRSRRDTEVKIRRPIAEAQRWREIQGLGFVLVDENLCKKYDFKVLHDPKEHEGEPKPKLPQDRSVSCLHPKNARSLQVSASRTPFGMTNRINEVFQTGINAITS